ncbi:hypothetical protein [Luteolibacter marinus]|uniref:hypothetical protein n=1 Tax=Luteolibacter marinus TaxID=2776705 RepID=UPI0018667D9B|nr:hypothetical protein [Luteolibacter marinus]
MKAIRIVVTVLLAAGLIAGSYFAGQKRSETAKVVGLRAEIEGLQAQVEAQNRAIGWRAGLNINGIDGIDPITRRHLIQQIWYSDQNYGTYLVGLQTGHKWGNRWNRRSPLSILEEQTEVMREFLKETRRLEEASGRPPRYPTEDHVDPHDGSRVDWQDFLASGEPPDRRVIWIGKSKNSGKWMAYEYGKGVYEADGTLLERIASSQRSAFENRVDPDADPFAPDGSE